MIQIQINGKTREYQFGTTWQTVTEEIGPRDGLDILLVKVDGKLQELHKKAVSAAQLEFITIKEKPGYQTYQRSAIFLMLKAFYEVAGVRNIKKLTVDYSIGNGIFVHPEVNFTLDQSFLDQVKEKMQEYTAQKIPIMKRNTSTIEAKELFHKHGMYDKERLFRYRRVSTVNIYSIGNFEDYFYGYMVQNTGYIKLFDLQLYHHGFVLVLPRRSNPKILEEFKPMNKLFGVLNETSTRGRRLSLANVGELNDQISRGDLNEVILMEEALMEKRIGEIAGMIGGQKEKKLIMIAGPSSSGKTTFSHRLSIQLRALGLKPHPIAVDNYFINRADTPRDEHGNYNYEDLTTIDIKLFNHDMNALLKGETIELPRYNFKDGVREYKGDFLSLGPDDILVIEGIHGLNDQLSHTLPKENKFKIYISALTSLNIDEHNRISTTDGRLLRRIVRDERTRGASAQDTIRMWDSVRNGEEKNIFPFQEDADVMFNSALLYELAILKQYAEPLLFGIPSDSPEHTEAKRLLKFLDYFLGVSSEEVPKTSILREFIGGSCFKV